MLRHLKWKTTNKNNINFWLLALQGHNLTLIVNWWCCQVTTWHWLVVLQSHVSGCWLVVLPDHNVILVDWWCCQVTAWCWLVVLPSHNMTLVVDWWCCQVTGRAGGSAASGAGPDGRRAGASTTRGRAGAQPAALRIWRQAGQPGENSGSVTNYVREGEGCQKAGLGWGGGGICA